MSLESPLPSLQSLSTSLQDLQRYLHPLLQQRFADVIGKLEQGSSAGGESSATSLDGRLDSAKLQVSIAYVLLDLIWVNLKLTGQEPATHEVHADLSRVRSYFSKIKSVENKGASATSESHNEHPPLPGQEQRLKVDRTAAARFVKGALASGEKGKHTKFDVSDGSDIEAEEGKGASSVKSAAVKKDSKGRTVKDPFEGYDASQEGTEKEDVGESDQPQKKRKASSARISEGPTMSTPTKLKKKKSSKKMKSSGGSSK